MNAPTYCAVQEWKMVTDTEKKKGGIAYEEGPPMPCILETLGPSEPVSRRPPAHRHSPQRPYDLYANVYTKSRPASLTTPSRDTACRLLRLRHPRLRHLTRKEVDVGIAARGAAQEGPVWVERRGGDGGPAVLLEEARVGLHARQLLAVEVEDLGGVGRGAAASC